MGLSLFFLLTKLFLLVISLSSLLTVSEQQSCDVFEGSWVFDASYPLYDASECPFIASDLNCQKNGRPDQMYLQYRWKPTACDISRFDGKEFLEKYRGKKVMYVGDSLSANQWESMGCMLHAAVPNANYSLSSRGPLTTLSFPRRTRRHLSRHQSSWAWPPLANVSTKVKRGSNISQLSRSVFIGGGGDGGFWRDAAANGGVTPAFTAFAGLALATAVVFTTKSDLVKIFATVIILKYVVVSTIFVVDTSLHFVYCFFLSRLSLLLILDENSVWTDIGRQRL